MKSFFPDIKRINNIFWKKIIDNYVEQDKKKYLQITIKNDSNKIDKDNLSNLKKFLKFAKPMKLIVFT